MRGLTLILVAFFCTILYGNCYAFDENLNEITIYWDASLSQKDKNTEKEFEFLDTFFNAYPNSKVKLITFNTQILSRNTFELKSSNWSALREQLTNIIYDGASDFGLVDTDVKGERLLFFTDGNGNFGNFKASLYSPRIITISSQTNANRKFLHQTSYYNRGYYVDLLTGDITRYMDVIKEKKMMPKLEFVVKDDKNLKYIQGIVTSEIGPISNASIEIANKNRATFTAEDGSYKIATEPGDVLLFKYSDKKSVTVEVGNEDIVDVKLTDLANELETVFIKSKIETVTENANIGDRVVDKKSLGFAVQSIGSDDISADEMDLGESMAGKFSGVQMGNNNDPGQMIIRGFDSFVGSNHPMFIIDGVPLPKSSVDTKSPMDIVDPSNIANVTVLKGLAATNRYGSLGRSGVVLITTKSSLKKYTSAEEEPDKPQEIEYKIFKSPLKIATLPKSNYVTMLKSFSDVNEAYLHYLKQQKSNLDNITYFIESADYFFEVGKEKIGIQVLSNLAELFPKDTSVLKILAFNLEKHKLFAHAQKVYKGIVDISPSMSQSYMDYANSHSENKEYQKSIDLYNKIARGKIKNVLSFAGIQDQIDNDFKSLLSKRNQTWKTKKVAPKYFTIPKYGVRVVIESSHPQTEYEIQYINPKKQYFILSHTQEKNAAVLKNELREGYTSEEFVLSEIEEGDWHMNLIIPKNTTPDIKYPRFIKVKVYTKFGMQNQQLQTHIINLDRITSNRIFTSFKI